MRLMAGVEQPRKKLRRGSAADRVQEKASWPPGRFIVCFFECTIKLHTYEQIKFALVPARLRNASASSRTM